MIEFVGIGLIVVALAAALSWQARRRDIRARSGTAHDSRSEAEVPQHDDRPGLGSS